MISIPVKRVSIFSRTGLNILGVKKNYFSFFNNSKGGRNLVTGLLLTQVKEPVEEIVGIRYTINTQ